MDVKLGIRTLEAVSENGTQIAWELSRPSEGMQASGEHQEEWVEIVVGVELQPWPDLNWLTFWREEDWGWPEHLEEPLLDGRKLVFGAPAAKLEEAWSAVKTRVEATNRAYSEFSTNQHEA